MPSSPVEDRKYFSPFTSSINNRKELKNYNWPSHSKIFFSSMYIYTSLVRIWKHLELSSQANNESAGKTKWELLWTLPWFQNMFLDKPVNYSTYDDNENVTNAPLNLSLNGHGEFIDLSKIFSTLYFRDIYVKITIMSTFRFARTWNHQARDTSATVTAEFDVSGTTHTHFWTDGSRHTRGAAFRSNVARYFTTSAVHFLRLNYYHPALINPFLFSGLAKQIVLTIPITHVTTDQVINLSLTDGQIIPTTVGELLKLAMPKSMFEDDVTGGTTLIYSSEINSSFFQLNPSACYIFPQLIYYAIFFF